MTLNKLDKLTKMIKNTIQNKTITRKQLCGLGVSLYHAKAVTDNIKPLGRNRGAYIYSINDVIASVREYILRPRSKVETRNKFDNILKILLSLLDNLMPASFSNSTDPEIGKLAKELLTAMAQTDATLAALKLDAAEIKAEYGMKGDKV